MKQTEEQLVQEIARLYSDLDSATYGKERSNGHIYPPDASKFYYSAKRMYDVADELIEKYQPAYVTLNDYRFIYDSQRTLLLELEVLKSCKKKQGNNLTWELEKYLSKIHGLFYCILSHSSLTKLL